MPRKNETFGLSRTVAILVVCHNQLQEQLPYLNPKQRALVERLLKAIYGVGDKLAPELGD